MLLTVGGHVLGDLPPQCARMATGFAGGVGDGQQEMCGALSGGAMVIGALYGRETVHGDDREAVARAARYRQAFADAFGATQCAHLRILVHASGGLGSCAALVERAAALLMEILETSG